MNKNHLWFPAIFLTGSIVAGISSCKCSSSPPKKIATRIASNNIIDGGTVPLSLDLSSDGKMIVYTRKNGSGDVCIKNVGSNNMGRSINLINSPYYEGGVCWGHDSSYFYYTSEIDGGSHIFRHSLTDGSTRKITSDGYNSAPYEIGGRYLIYMESDPEGRRGTKSQDKFHLVDLFTSSNSIINVKQGRKFICGTGEDGKSVFIGYETQGYKIEVFKLDLISGNMSLFYTASDNAEGVIIIESSGMANIFEMERNRDTETSYHCYKISRISNGKLLVIFNEEKYINAWNFSDSGLVFVAGNPDGTSLIIYRYDLKNGKLIPLEGQ
jgi:WD40 repeat protein